MARRKYLGLEMGFLLALFITVWPISTCLAAHIPQVPDVQQPITGSLGNPTTNSCAPVSVVNVTEYWDNVVNDPGANMVNAGLVPKTAADYISYFVDHGNWGSPARRNGTMYPISTGTYSADIEPGFNEFVRWDAAHLFTTPPPALPPGKAGYDWNHSTDYVNGFGKHVASIDSGHPDVICFRYWNPVFSGFIMADPSGETIEFYTWGPQVSGSGPPNPPEQWNLNYGQECVGHAVTGVGYLIGDPDGPGPLPNAQWFICHDNWPTTGINVALQWGNWAATIFGYPNPQEPPEITYWKPDTTYAQTGMPDFPSQYPCHSGATAVTNCLWWYGAMDYYQFNNPRQLKDELLIYFAADTIFDPWGGTDVHQMEMGLDAYFNDVDPPWPFYETTYPMPDFHVMAESLMKCQDVILLIGNWWQDAVGTWWRDGGRYVTMAGADTATHAIALSDPETDNAEAGGFGQVRPPHAVHSPTGNTHWFPMTAGGYDYPVSHDTYPVTLNSLSPGGTWWIPGFPRGFSPPHANCPAEFMPMTQGNPNPQLYPYHAEVEYAVMICPKRLPEPIDTCNYYKAPYIDYAQNGVPDFDQKQDGWHSPLSANWSWCGPVALANCIWWFDSKFEPLPIDPRPFQPDPTSPPPNDHYPLLGPMGPWDDHDMNNVIPFISALGPMCGVDGPSPGTALPQLQAGFHNWLNAVGLPGEYSSFIVMGPGYPQIRDSILASQDVILLLGFYELLPTEDCQRLGGHYVTSAGVCTQEPSICISDPFFDSNEGEPPPGSAHGSAVHNDAFFVSGPHGSINHDRYNMAPVGQPCPTSPATWMMTDYPNGWTQDGLFNFANQNTLLPGMPPAVYQGGPIMVLVDAALIICPAPPAIPDIDVRPESLFYQQNSYTSVTYPHQIIICNTGTGLLNINSITSDHPWVTPGPFLSTLAAGQCDTVDVIVNTAGIAPNIYIGRFHVNSNDPDEATVNKPWYSVRVIEPDIQVTPDSIFHSQLVNTVQIYPNNFTISNIGTAPLNYATVNAIPWIGLIGVTGLIMPGGIDNIGISVNTNGVAPGIYVDVVTINSNDPDTPVLNKPKIVIQVTQPPPDSLYWKDFNGPQADGGFMPDFDQNQLGWNAYCGPVSIANSLWWYQGKFPERVIVPPQFYPQNPLGFIQFLSTLMGTNVQTLGTHVDSVQAGIERYLTMMQLHDLLYEHTVYQPPFDLVEYEIERCQDVTLLIGFWMVQQFNGQTVDWMRIGGHYVTVAGVNSQGLLLGISDPDADNFEDNVSRGVLRGPNHQHGGVPFQNPAYNHLPHNDGISASHDVYDVVTIPCSPGGLWELEAPYWHQMPIAYRYEGENGGMYMLPGVPWNPGCPFPPQQGMIFAEIEAAVIVSPREAAPDINVVPDSIFHSLVMNTIVNYLDDFSIYNLGTGPLNWSATNSLSWLVLGTNSGSILPGDDVAIDITVNATSIPVGTYYDTVRISSNDPDEPLVSQPRYVIEVTTGEIGCDYIIGDINGNGSANGIDVTYGVSYLKGGSAPPDSCDCPPMAFPFYAAMDVNGNCAANGIDITYFVSYLKGQQPSLLYCEDCPPADRGVPAVAPIGPPEKTGGKTDTGR